MALFNFKPPKKKKVLKKNMSWPQAKARYPKLKRYADSDKDGIRNWLDCKPLNKNKQGFIHELINPKPSEINKANLRKRWEDFRPIEDDLMKKAIKERVQQEKDERNRDLDNIHKRRMFERSQINEAVKQMDEFDPEESELSRY